MVDLSKGSFVVYSGPQPASPQVVVDPRTIRVVFAQTPEEAAAIVARHWTAWSQLQARRSLPMLWYRRWWAWARLCLFLWR